jgi:hypothetical protein
MGTTLTDRQWAERVGFREKSARNQREKLGRTE